jgi:tetratricopeptide (TPR) repeat protein
MTTEAITAVFVKRLDVVGPWGIAALRRHWRPVLVISLLSILTAALIVRLFSAKDPFIRVDDLPFRPSTARLSADIRYRPVRTGMVDGATRSFGFLMLMKTMGVDDPRQAYVETLYGVAEIFHEVGISELVEGRAESAIIELQGAVDRARSAPAPYAAALLNDLAVAHYQMGLGGDVVHFVIALDCAERAWRLAPSRQTTWTRAILFERLGLVGAANAWRQVLQRDNDPGWSWEAREHLDRLLRSQRRSAPRELFRARAGEFDEAGRIVEAFPAKSRTLATDFAARGWSEWSSGSALVKKGRLTAAVDAYERAATAFRNAREMENVAAVLSLRADVLDSMAATDEGWLSRMSAISILHNCSGARLPFIWNGLAMAAMRDHYELPQTSSCMTVKRRCGRFRTYNDAWMRRS